MKKVMFVLGLIVSANLALAAGGKPEGEKKKTEEVPQHKVAVEFGKRFESVLGSKVETKGISDLLNVNPTLIPLMENVRKTISETSAKKTIESEKSYFTGLLAKVNSISAKAAEWRADKPAMAIIRASTNGKVLLDVMEVSASVIREAAQGGASADRAKIDAFLDAVDKISKSDLTNEAQASGKLAEIEKILGVDAKTFITNCKL